MTSCPNRLPTVKFVSGTLLILELIGLVTLTSDLLTSNLTRVTVRGVDNLHTNYLMFLRLFVLDLWSIICQTLHVTF